MTKMNRPKSMAAIAIIATFLLAEVPFGLAEWLAVGEAPGQVGVYNVVIQATYNGVTGNFPLQLIVNNTAYPMDGLKVEPVYPISKVSPITLRYDISLNGSKNFEMVSSNLTVYYITGGGMLKSSTQELVYDNESYWTASIDVPLKGEYKAVVVVIVEKDGQLYGGQFLTHFESDEMSPDVQITYKPSKRVLTPAESFDVELRAIYQEQALPGLDIFKASVYGSTKTLRWDSAKRVYSATFTAPTKEGAYLLNVYAAKQDYIKQEKVYVAEVSKAKSARCPMSAGVTFGCTDMKDVRRCVADWKSETIPLKEEQLISCFESATGGMIYESVICNAQKKGDLDGDNEIDVDDVDLLQNLILPLSSSARKDYVKCADYNLDETVDANDLKCLTNVVAGKWYGDLHGGVCFDATYDSPLKGDLTGDKFVKDDDVLIMKKLLTAADAGVVLPPTILSAVDFDQNGRLTRDDFTCISYFVGMELAKPETMLAAGQTIPRQCMAIYDLNNCQKVRGDLNGDLKIDSVDEILIMLINAKQIANYDIACADVNKDSSITLEDVACVKAYTSGDRSHFFACLGCTENTPPDYRQMYEVCGDGYDNDCDGLTDRTSTNPTADMCRCTELTPCWMVLDADGGTSAGVSDGKVKVCRKVEWDAGSDEATGGEANNGFKWMTPSALTCQKDRECKSMLCADTVYKCAYGTNNWKWYDIEEGLPIETDIPDDTPKTCGDTYDNDCNCGDRKCAKKEGSSMFGSSSFWIGAGLGLVTGFMTGGTMMNTILSLGSTVGGFLTDDPNLKAGLSGFGLGMAVGGWARGTQWGQNAMGKGTVSTTTKVGDVQDMWEQADNLEAQGYTSSGMKGDVMTLTKGSESYVLDFKAQTVTTGSTSTSLWSKLTTPNWDIKGVGSGVSSSGAKWYASSQPGWAIAGIAGLAGAMMASSSYEEKTAVWVHTADCSSESGD